MFTKFKYSHRWDGQGLLSLGRRVRFLLGVPILVLLLSACENSQYIGSELSTYVEAREASGTFTLEDKYKLEVPYNINFTVGLGMKWYWKTN